LAQAVVVGYSLNDAPKDSVDCYPFCSLLQINFSEFDCKPLLFKFFQITVLLAQK
jgi:hypothetical protein